MFILMGLFADLGGITNDVMRSMRAWLGRLPGGIACSVAMGCAGFAACTGSSAGATAVVGKMTIPEMLKSGYKPELATGVVAASGTLASLIPPSVLICVYGVLTDQPIGMLLLAGFIPGILSAIVYIGQIIVRASIFPDLAPTNVEKATWSEKINSLRGLWGVVLIMGLILGGIYTGVFTPTEAGALGALAAFIIALYRRRVTIQGLRASLLETVTTTCMIFFGLVGVLFLMRFLVLSGLLTLMLTTVATLEVNRWLIFGGMIAVYIILGCFIGAIGMMAITLPVFFPIIISLGFDSLWFGIVIIKMCEIALITPPVGVNCYITHNVAPEVPLEKIFSGILPFLAMDILTLVLFCVFPQVVTWLPSMAMAS